MRWHQHWLYTCGAADLLCFSHVFPCFKAKTHWTLTSCSTPIVLNSRTCTDSILTHVKLLWGSQCKLERPMRTRVFLPASTIRVCGELNSIKKAWTWSRGCWWSCSSTWDRVKEKKQGGRTGEEESEWIWTDVLTWCRNFISSWIIKLMYTSVETDFFFLQFGYF